MILTSISDLGFGMGRTLVARLSRRVGAGSTGLWVSSGSLDQGDAVC